MKVFLKSRGFAFVALAIIGFGCASGSQNSNSKPVTYVPTDQMGEISGTGIESQDIGTVTDLMVKSISEVIQYRVHEPGKTPLIGVLPVDNSTRFDIDSRLFTTRIRVLLSKRMLGQVSFVARERMNALYEEHQRKEVGVVTGGEEQFAPKGVDYFLTGELLSISTKTRAGQSDYVLYTFRLIDANTSEEVWTDMAELKKEGREDAAYR